MKEILLLSVAGIMLGGCCNAPLQSAESNVPLGLNYRQHARLEGKSCQWYALNFLPVTGGNRVQDAIDDAISESSDEALTGMTVDTRFEFYLLFSRRCTVVRGTGITFQKSK